MEQFKSIVREALQNGACDLLFEADHNVLLFFDENQPLGSEQEDFVDEEWLRFILEKLFKQDFPNIKKGPPLMGELKSSAGKIMLVASDYGNLKLRVFVANRVEERAKEYWTEVNKQSPLSNNNFLEPYINRDGGSSPFAVDKEDLEPPSPSFGLKEDDDDIKNPILLKNSSPQINHEPVKSIHTSSSGLEVENNKKDIEKSIPIPRGFASFDNYDSVSPTQISALLSPENFLASEDVSAEHMKSHQAVESSLSSMLEEISLSRNIELKLLLQKLVDSQASQMYLSSSMSVAYRINNTVISLDEIVLSQDDITNILKPLISDLSLSDLEINLDKKLVYELESVGTFKVHLYKDCRGLCAVFSYIDYKLIDYNKYDCPYQILDLFRLKSGLVFVVGKNDYEASYSMNCILNHINAKQSKYIVSIEENIDIMHKKELCHITQRELSKQTDIAELSKNIRSDRPDIIFVNAESSIDLDLALQLARSGSLVFYTLTEDTLSKAMLAVVKSVGGKKDTLFSLSKYLRGLFQQSLVMSPSGVSLDIQCLLTNDLFRTLLLNTSSKDINNYIENNSLLFQSQLK